VRAAGFICLTALLFPWAAVLLQTLPLVDWDARSIWFFHGKALYLAGRVTGEYFGNSLYAWSHPDYPLLIPVQAAWTALFVGHWHEYAVKAFLGFNLAAYLQLLCLVLRERKFPWWLAVAVGSLLLDQYTYGYVNGYADNHYIAVLILFMLAAPVARAGTGPLLTLLLAFAANTKSEGLVYVLLLAGGVLVHRFVRSVACSRMHEVPRSARNDKVCHSEESPPRRESGRRGISIPSNALWAVVIGAAPVLVWLGLSLGFRAGRGGAGLAAALGDLLGLQPALAARGGEVARFLAVWFVQRRTAHLVTAVIVWRLLHMLLQRRGLAPTARMPRAAVLALAGSFVLTGLIFLVFLFTPRDLSWHLQTAAGRLLHFPHMTVCLSLLFCVEPFLPGLCVDRDVDTVKS